MRRLSPARAPLAAASALTLVAGTAATAGTAAAQVGHEPERSPFVDLRYRQSVTPFAGYFFAATDPAGVAPESAPLVGVRYDLFLGGPASFTARIATATTERRVIDPARPAARRVLGVEQRPLTLADVGFSFALTGQKSWHGLVPLVHTGLGLATNFAGADPGGFNLGTRFALDYGAGIRIVPSGRLAFRIDASRYAYQIRYPDRYFQPAIDSTQVLETSRSKSKWLNNAAVTVGASYQFFR
jgi:hypothetical protein